GIGAWRLNGCAGDPSIMFGRDFLVTTKCTVDFGLGEMRVDLTILVEDRDIDTMLASLVEDMGEVGSASNELVKMGKANQKKNHNVNKLKPPTSPKIEEIPPISSSAPQPVYHPLSPKQKEKILGALDRKYKELEEQKPIVEVLENYMVYRKKLDEVMMGRARLENKNFGDEEKDRLIENGLPKKMYDPGNFVLSVQVNKTTQLSALADMGASMSVLPYTLFKNLGLSDPRPYQSNLTMADNTQAKAIGEVINVRIQIGYQAYLADFLVLDILVDKELPLLLGRLFLRTCGEIIDMGHGTMTIDDGVIRHTYFPKPRAKAYLENLEIDEDKDWLGCFEILYRVDGGDFYENRGDFCENYDELWFIVINNPFWKGVTKTQVLPVAPSEANMPDIIVMRWREALSLECILKPLQDIFVFKKLIDFLGSLSVQLKNIDWGSEGHGIYKKAEGDGSWHSNLR
ncbi:DNA-directed DNA polymerase, partial [Tanacetum coccineum]